MSRASRIKTLVSALAAGVLLTAGNSGVRASVIELPTGRSEGLQLLVLLTVLSLAPSILIMMTGFTRIVIVLSFTRNALGLQQTPPNQVIIGLALLLTLFFMAPVVDDIGENAYKPYVAGTITQEEALEKAMEPLRDFMFRNTYRKDMEMFMGMAGIASVETVGDIPTKALIPAFVTSELKRAVQIGFFIFIPFLVIDMIVASTLMSMGMMMLPPTIISLPFKVLLFVLVDGWVLTIQTLITGFG